jgi:hypothetical protein
MIFRSIILIVLNINYIEKMNKHYGQIVEYVVRKAGYNAADQCYEIFQLQNRTDFTG